MKLKYLVIIPARANSKGFPKKNHAKFGNKTLAEKTIHDALAVFSKQDIAVTSDDKKILSLAESLHCAHVITRPKKLATAKATMSEVVLHLLNQPAIKTSGYTHFILLQVTSPLRTPIHIRRAIKALKTAKSLISVTESPSNAWKMLSLAPTGYLSPIHGKRLNQNRQQLPKTFLQNGAIYISDIKSFLRQKTFLINPCVPLEMDAAASIDIDTKADLKKAKGTL